ncbi:MAG: heat-inducible transcriptional repressor HrcA [Desulfuromonadales bacterium]
MAEELSQRYRQILKAIIVGHIETAEPVGSGSVSRRSRLGISPATVRNVMAQLEDMGYLISPHASAGRIPTCKAYRYYVDSLLQLGTLSNEQRRDIENRYRHGTLPVEYELQSAGRALSDISRYAGIVVVPRFSTTIFRHLEFVRLNDRRLLLIMVSASGMVHKKLLDITEPVKQNQLDQAANYLNRTLSGLSIADARDRIARDITRERALYDELSRWTLQLSQAALEDQFIDQVFIEGASQILEQPEFADLSRMKKLMRIFDQKNLLLELLEKSQKEDSVHICIPEEKEFPDFPGCSLITARYTNGQGVAGSIGILGPMRMPYSKVVPVVSYMARLISGAMTNESIQEIKKL